MRRPRRSDRRIARTALVVVLGCATPGCRTRAAAPATASSGPSGEVHATGEVAALHDGLAEVTTSARGTALDVVLTSSETCAAVTDGPHAHEQFLELFLFAHAPGDALDTAATRAGTYRVDRGGPGPYVEANLAALDDHCQLRGSPAAFTAGTVTVTAIAGGAVTGTFDLTGARGHVTGSFATVDCPGANALTNANAGACR